MSETFKETIIISLKSGETSIPKVIHAITFLTTSLKKASENRVKK
jgi:hypothetical protein